MYMFKAPVNNDKLSVATSVALSRISSSLCSDTCSRVFDCAFAGPHCVSSPSSGSGASGRCSSCHPHGQHGLLGGGRGLHGAPQCPVHPLHPHLPPLPLLPPGYPARLRRDRTAGKEPLMLSPLVLGQLTLHRSAQTGTCQKRAATVCLERGFEIHVV
jgi:hypothetical protein